ncbi:MAG TPA: DUF2891 domain-containing protein [Terriglobales bacterium]
MKTLDMALAERIAALSLGCVHREYPTKVSHLLSSNADVLPPRRLTPAFYGCYDWHSAVHNHWLLARLTRLLPHASFAPAARAALLANLTWENIAGEVAYLEGEGRQAFERPYGLAWLLELSLELHEWNDSMAADLARNLLSLELEVKRRLSEWLPKLQHPVRSGEHSQTAFALGLLIDYARGRDDPAFLDLLIGRGRDFYLNDKNCPLDYEPSGEDFLSPGLMEADVMRRILKPQPFATWLSGFFPQPPVKLQPAISADRRDPKFSHLDGLNLSRAWALEGIRSGLPASDPRGAPLCALAEAHAQAGLAAISGDDYVGSHWLGTFAVYLLTRRGLPG